MHLYNHAYTELFLGSLDTSASRAVKYTKKHKLLVLRRRTTKLHPVRAARTCQLGGRSTSSRSTSCWSRRLRWSARRLLWPRARPPGTPYNEAAEAVQTWPRVSGILCLCGVHMHRCIQKSLSVKPPCNHCIPTREKTIAT